MSCGSVLSVTPRHTAQRWIIHSSFDTYYNGENDMFLFAQVDEKSSQGAKTSIKTVPSQQDQTGNAMKIVLYMKNGLRKVYTDRSPVSKRHPLFRSVSFIISYATCRRRRSSVVSALKRRTLIPSPCISLKFQQKFRQLRVVPLGRWNQNPSVWTEGGSESE